jgi:hypothetical protein
MRKALLGLVLAFVGVSASAASGITMNDRLTGWTAAPGGGFVRISDVEKAAAGARVWTAATGATVSTLNAAETAVVAARGGALAVAATSSITMADAAIAVGRCVMGANVVCAVGSVAALAYGAYRVKNPAAVPGSTVPAGQLDYDPGVVQQTIQGYSVPQVVGVFSCAGGCAVNVGPTTGTTPAAAVDAWVTKWNASDYNGRIRVYNVRNGGATFDIERASCPGAWGCGGFSYSYWNTFTPAAAQITNCPASIDPFDAQYNVPAGGAVGSDGKCESARYFHTGITPEVAASHVVDVPASKGADWSKATSDAVDKANQPVPAQLTSSGPATQTGAPTVTHSTDANGVNTTITETPTYNYTYAGDHINMTSSVTTQTCVGAGSCSTSKTDAPPPAPQDPKDPCTLHPDSAGCAALGDPGQAGDIPQTKVPVTSGTVTFAAPGGCPAGHSFSIFAHSYTISYQGLCDTLGPIRLIFLALGAAMAAMIFMEGLKV